MSNNLEKSGWKLHVNANREAGILLAVPGKENEINGTYVGLVIPPGENITLYAYQEPLPTNPTVSDIVAFIVLRGAVGGKPPDMLMSHLLQEKEPRVQIPAGFLTEEAKTRILQSGLSLVGMRIGFEEQAFSVYHDSVWRKIGILPAGSKHILEALVEK
jgi:hypothetical protein